MAGVIPSAPLGTDAANRFGPVGATVVRPGAAAERRFRFELAAHPGSVARARRLTRARLAGWAVCEDTCDTAALVVSELVTNAIVHTAAEHVVCELRDEDDVVRIAVQDEGCAPGEPHPSPERPEEEHGRGLLLVAALCRAWGAQKAGPGLLVWAELAREADQPVSGERSHPAQPARDLSCSGGRSRATEDPAVRYDLGWSPRKPPVGGEPRSDLGWSAKRPPADRQDSGADATWGAGTEWV
ncbi:ATP-binding protein [Streptomyces chiangmaiensis]|uniref:ATP-binding protein n=1 Tax=Streptomyces chiangmaiensis TaxID=766497 RepID=A0ABU7FNV1_9ACTN|nr:ATP-binding protein [Streptomyces chiangmaiensis]MED7825795.1 ATP-binding protein [Streptomyces chiangmaiensis]